MAGGTAEHALLAMVVGGEIMVALRGGRCRVYSSDMRARVRKTGLSLALVQCCLPRCV